MVKKAFVQVSRGCAVDVNSFHKKKSLHSEQGRRRVRGKEDKRQKREGRDRRRLGHATGSMFKESGWFLERGTEKTSQVTRNV